MQLWHVTFATLIPEVSSFTFKKPFLAQAGSGYPILQGAEAFSGIQLQQDMTQVAAFGRFLKLQQGGIQAVFLGRRNQAPWRTNQKARAGAHFAALKAQGVQARLTTSSAAQVMPISRESQRPAARKEVISKVVPARRPKIA